MVPSVAETSSIAMPPILSLPLVAVLQLRADDTSRLRQAPLPLHAEADAEQLRDPEPRGELDAFVHRSDATLRNRSQAAHDLGAVKSLEVLLTRIEVPVQ